MSFMSTILGLIKLPESMRMESIYLAVKMRTGQRLTSLAGTRLERSWFSVLEEKEFRSRQLERRAQVESVVRLTLAR